MIQRAGETFSRWGRLDLAVMPNPIAGAIVIGGGNLRNLRIGKWCARPEALPALIPFPGNRGTAPIIQ